MSAGGNLGPGVGVGHHGVGYPHQVGHDELPAVISFKKRAHDRQIVDLAGTLGLGTGQHGVDLRLFQRAAPTVIEKTENHVERGCHQPYPPSGHKNLLSGVAPKCAGSCLGKHVLGCREQILQPGGYRY